MLLKFWHLRPTNAYVAKVKANPKMLPVLIMLRALSYRRNLLDLVCIRNLVRLYFLSVLVRQRSSNQFVFPGISPQLFRKSVPRHIHPYFSLPPSRIDGDSSQLCHQHLNKQRGHQQYCADKVARERKRHCQLDCDCNAGALRPEIIDRRMTTKGHAISVQTKW